MDNCRLLYTVYVSSCIRMYLRAASCQLYPLSYPPLYLTVVPPPRKRDMNMTKKNSRGEEGACRIRLLLFLYISLTSTSATFTSTSTSFPVVLAGPVAVAVEPESEPIIKKYQNANAVLPTYTLGVNAAYRLYTTESCILLLLLYNKLYFIYIHNHHNNLSSIGIRLTEREVCGRCGAGCGAATATARTRDTVCV